MLAVLVHLCMTLQHLQTGVAYLLAELGIITPMTKVAGASSGALLSMGLCSGITDDKFQQVNKIMALGTVDLCTQCGLYV